MFGKRRNSRQCALQNLFAWDITREIQNPLLGSDGADVEDRPYLLDNTDWDYAKRLVEGVITHHIRVDAIIRKYAKNWKLERMSVVDRCILRLSVYELLFCPDIPRSVVIDEAIEMAKHYGDSESHRFINGNLDPIAKHECVEGKGEFAV